MSVTYTSSLCYCVMGMWRKETDANYCSFPVLSLTQMSFDPNLLHNNGHNGYPNGTSAALRETGVIEKLLTSYGFIQCSERQARLFFHCSQYNGNLQELKVGGNWALGPAPVSSTCHKIPSYLVAAASGAKLTANNPPLLVGALPSALCGLWYKLLWERKRCSVRSNLSSWDGGKYSDCGRIYFLYSLFLCLELVWGWPSVFQHEEAAASCW